MKIRIEMAGAGAARPDFGMLKEGLRVAQETTPTAIASGRGRASRDRDALVRMLAGAAAPVRAAAPNCFYPDLPPGQDGETER